MSSLRWALVSFTFAMCFVVWGHHWFMFAAMFTATRTLFVLLREETRPERLAEPSPYAAVARKAER